MNENNELPFGQVLDHLLLSEDAAALDLVYRLSDMAHEERQDFEARWMEAPTDRRSAIVRQMAELTEENFIVDFAPVFAFCLADPNPDVRRVALGGLWDASDERLVPPILDLLENDTDDRVRVASAQALSHFIQMAEWGEIAGRHTERITDALLKAYEKPESSLLLRKASLEALGAISLPLVQAHIERAYEGDDHDLRLSALFAMGMSGDSRWMATVLDEMESPFPEMRAEAARAAGSIGMADAVLPLAELVLDEEKDVALAAIYALGHLDSDESLAVLSEFLSDPDFAHLHRAIAETMEETEWMGADFDLFSLDDEGSWADPAQGSEAWSRQDREGSDEFDGATEDAMDPDLE
jgi:HEAT repeat protein